MFFFEGKTAFTGEVLFPPAGEVAKYKYFFLQKEPDGNWIAHPSFLPDAQSEYRLQSQGVIDHRDQTWFGSFDVLYSSPHTSYDVFGSVRIPAYWVLRKRSFEYLRSSRGAEGDSGSTPVAYQPTGPVTGGADASTISTTIAPPNPVAEPTFRTPTVGADDGSADYNRYFELGPPGPSGADAYGGPSGFYTTTTTVPTTAAIAEGPPSAVGPPSRSPQSVGGSLAQSPYSAIAAESGPSWASGYLPESFSDGLSTAYNAIVPSGGSKVSEGGLWKAGIDAVSDALALVTALPSSALSTASSALQIFGELPPYQRAKVMALAAYGLREFYHYVFPRNPLFATSGDRITDERRRNSFIGAALGATGIFAYLNPFTGEVYKSSKTKKTLPTEVVGRVHGLIPPRVKATPMGTGGVTGGVGGGGSLAHERYASRPHRRRKRYTNTYYKKRAKPYVYNVNARSF